MTNLLSMLLIFVPVVFYPPFLFLNVIPATSRIGLLSALTMFLFLATSRFRIERDLTLFALFSVLLPSILIVNIDSTEGLRTAGNVTLTLLFAYALKRAVETNDFLKRNLIKAYGIFFLLVPICSLLSVIFYLLFGQLNLFNIHSVGYDYIYTPFGVMLEKKFFGLVVYRSFFFFDEPVYLALFYAANIFVFAPNSGNRSNWFLYANVVGGVLTFSYLFFAYVVFFFASKGNVLFPKNAVRLLLTVTLIVGTLMLDFLSSSSIGNRMQAIYLFVAAMTEANALQWMFGRGFSAYDNLVGHFSGGFFATIYEIGVVNLIILLLFTFVLCSRNMKLFVVFLIAMFVFEPLKLPLVWVLTVVLASSWPGSPIKKGI